MAAKRPYSTEYYTNKNTLFKKGHASTPERAICAIVRTLTQNRRRHVTAYVYNGTSIAIARVRTTAPTKIAIWRK